MFQLSGFYYILSIPGTVRRLPSESSTASSLQVDRSAVASTWGVIKGPQQLPILFSGVPYYNYSIIGPPNPILIIKAPIVGLRIPDSRVGASFLKCSSPLSPQKTHSESLHCVAPLKRNHQLHCMTSIFGRGFWGLGLWIRCFEGVWALS